MGAAAAIHQDNLLCLTVRGSRQLRDVCLGLLAALIKGAIEHQPAALTGVGSLDLYIEGGRRRQAEGILSRWQKDVMAGEEVLVYDWSKVPQEDWQLNWREHFKALKVTDKITIVPDWDTTTRAPGLIRIRPGMAFGTGHHATTQLVIQTLEASGCRGARVLDMGTGSGVLAIAAVLSGADRVVAVENDPDCAENFNQNLELNGLAGQVEWRQGDALRWDEFGFDIIMANIQRSVIFPFLEKFARSGSSAKVLASGLLVEEEPLLREHCAALNLPVAGIRREGEWCCAVIEAAA